MSRSTSGYRADIDGLRAIAVLSVVIYHFRKALVPGGFVGVDIFFVISGFLITRNIWGEMLSREFRFANFYLRRVRRIAPAFLVMALVTVVAGVFLLLPTDLLALARSALWGTFSLANVYFWRHLDTSYFAESSDQVPMLHTWSLGVEEQFYFFWPALLIAASLVKWKRSSALAVALAVCVASFVCAELTNVVAQKFSYYMLPARAGELMIGAILAIWQTNEKGGYKDSKAPWWLAELLALLGFGLVVFSLVHLNDASAFPGINAIYPCVGTALLIVAGGMPSRLVRALLMPRPMVAIGLVSYSLYLWHWPVLAYIRYFYGAIEGWHAWVGAAVILLLSILSYRFVEVPARRYRATPARQVALLYAVPSLVIAGVAIAVMMTGGLKSLIESSSAYRDGLARLDSETAPAYKFHYNCQLSQFDDKILSDPRCVIGSVLNQSDSVRPKILLWGDSEAAHYIGVLGRLAKSDGFTFRNATVSSCPPVFGGDYGEGIYKAGCDRFRPYVRNALRSGTYSTVVMSGAWSHYFSEAEFESNLEHTLDEITAAGAKVILIGEAPYFAGYDRSCDLRAVRIGGGSCQDRQSIPDSGPASADKMLAEMVKAHPRVTYLDLRDILCRAGTCSPYLDGHPVFFNPTHLSMAGSWRIGQKLLESPDRAIWTDALTGRVAASTTPTDEQAKTSRVSTPVSKASILPIIGGYVPDFPYNVRSQNRADALDGHGGIVLEFWGTRFPNVVSSIKESMESKGFTMTYQGKSGSAIRMDFTKTGLPVISANVGPLGVLSPQTLQAEGIVYIRW